MPDAQSKRLFIPESKRVDMTNRIGEGSCLAALAVITLSSLPAKAQPNEQTSTQALETQHAVVISEWEKYRSDVFLLREGHFCGVLKVDQAGVATIKLMALMERDQRRLGLSGEQRLNVRKTVSEWWHEDFKKNRVSSSKCSRYSPDDNSKFQSRAAEIAAIVVEL